MELVFEGGVPLYMNTGFYWGHFSLKALCLTKKYCFLKKLEVQLDDKFQGLLFTCLPKLTN